MTAASIVAAELRQRRRMLGALAAGVFVFLLALGSTYQAFGGASGFTESFGKTPSFFSAFAGEAGVNVFAPANYLAFGFAHPLFLVLTLTVALSIGSASVAGDVETGRAEMLYVHPLRRTAIIDARIALWLGAQLGILVVAVAGAFVGSRLSADLRHVAFAGEVRAVVQYVPLALCFGGVAFAASALSRTRGQALGAAIGLTALAYLVNFVALLWHPIAFARRLTPFGYYSPTRALHAIVWWHAAVLLAAALVLLAVARIVVERRDLV
jgi:ABC-2 type transport system permease protein